MGAYTRDQYIRWIEDNAIKVGRPLSDEEKVELDKMKRPELAKWLIYLQAKIRKGGPRWAR